MPLLPPHKSPGRLSAGDRMPNFAWRDTKGRHITLELPEYAGRLSIVLACPAPLGSGVQRELTKLRDLGEKWRDLDVQVIAVTPAPARENVALAAKLKLPFPILCDAGFALGRALGLEGGGSGAGARKKARASAVVIVDPNQRIEQVIPAAGDGRQSIRALGYCEKRAARNRPVDPAAVPEAMAGGQAPVLILPQVLTPEHCARLVRVFEGGEIYEGGVASTEHGSKVALEKIKIRQDVALADNGPEAQDLIGIFRRRLFLEIKKAFNYRVTRAETFRLGRYTAEAGGHFVPHRDDTTPYNAHRHFAMSINLNAGEYQGGSLRFPEYGPQAYGAQTGAAIVFSCSLLHEVTAITRGERFVLLGFYYSEEGQAMREKLRAK